jgi:LAS superfamily LD-carboxypeptidase LdcB
VQLSLKKILLITASTLLFNNAAVAKPPMLLAVSSQPTHDASISDSFLMGKYSASKRSDFVRISTRYASRAGMYLQSLPYDAFKAMYNDAKNSGVDLKIISATRSFYHQKSIWEAKWTGKRSVGGIRNITRSIKNYEKRAVKILEYSSMPGSSRHHWGTDIDLNSFNNKYFASGKGKKTYDWLVKNAPRYGFCQPYTPKGKARASGYNEEKWHWSFRPLSQHYTQQARLRLTDRSFTGFAGSSTATRIGIISKYVLGIDPSCF